METKGAISSWLSDLLDWGQAILQSLWWFVGSIGVGGAIFLIEHYTGSSIPWLWIKAVLLGGVLLSAFQAWREQRHKVLHYGELLEAIKLPDFVGSYMQYAWLGDVGRGLGVLADIVVVNGGDGSRVSDWEMVLDLPSGEVSGEIGDIPSEILGGDLMRTRQRYYIETLTRDHGAGHVMEIFRSDRSPMGILWATFEGVAKDEVSPNAIRVRFRDKNRRQYTITPGATIARRMNRERNTTRPFEGRESPMQRILRLRSQKPN
jgi:hypothetical protein